MARKDEAKKYPDEKVVDESGRCTVASDAERCWFPGTISGNTHGGPWVCRFHYRCPPELIVPVIEASRKWYEDSRAGRPVPEKFKAWDGKELPGFGTKVVRRFSVV